MQTRTRLQDETDVSADDGDFDAIPASDEILTERSVGYLETLPERLGAVGLVARTAIEALLGIRFLLHASGANTSSAFVGFIDDASWIFAAPFANVFSDISWGFADIEISTLVAMGVYLLVFKLLGMLVTALAPRLSGVTARRGVSALWSSAPMRATTTPTATDDEPRRRPRLASGTGETRRQRRILRRTRPRES